MTTRGGRIIKLSAVLTRLTTSAPQKAAQNPSTRKPNPSALLTALVNHNIKPLMMNMNRPSVKTISGKVSIFCGEPDDRIDHAKDQRDAEEGYPAS